MVDRRTKEMSDLMVVSTMLYLALPLVSLRWRMGLSTEQAPTLAVWRSYDALVRLSTATLDLLIAAPQITRAAGGQLAPYAEYRHSRHDGILGEVLSGGRVCQQKRLPLLMGKRQLQPNGSAHGRKKS